jgi:hypothetical protein
MDVNSKEYKELVDKLLSNKSTLPILPILTISDYKLTNPWNIFYSIGYPVGRLVEYVQFYNDKTEEFVPLSQAPKSFLDKYYNMNLGEINLEIVFGENRDKIWKRRLEKDFTPFQLLEEITKIYNTKLTGKEKIYDLEGNLTENTFKGRLPLELITFQASLFGFEKRDSFYRIIFDYY